MSFLNSVNSDHFTSGSELRKGTSRPLENIPWGRSKMEMKQMNSNFMSHTFCRNATRCILCSQQKYLKIRSQNDSAVIKKYFVPLSLICSSESPKNPFQYDLTIWTESPFILSWESNIPTQLSRLLSADNLIDRPLHLWYSHSYQVEIGQHDKLTHLCYSSHKNQYPRMTSFIG